MSGLYIRRFSLWIITHYYPHGIDYTNCSQFEVIDDDNETLIFLKIKPSQRICIHCKNSGSNIKEYKTKTIHSLSTGKNKTTITFSLPRYICNSCHKTYTHSLNAFAPDSISNLVRLKILDDFSEIITFKSIAKKYNISITKVINLFDEICPNLKIPFTQAICIDEFSNIRNSDFKFACLIVDFISHKIIDIIPSRTTPYLDQYFNDLSLKTRLNVKYIITDMYDGYISASKRWFPNAIIAIDPFHYMECLSDAVQSIRRRILDDDSIFLFDKSWMSSHWRLLTTNLKNFPQENMTLKSGMTISYYDRVKRFCSQNNELYYAFLFIQGVYYVLNKLSFDKAYKYFDGVIKTLLNSTIPEFVKCGFTWSHYKEFIVNSFIVFNGKRLSNGPIEGTNKRVKDLKHIMSGYRNSARFYKRFIYIQNRKKDR